MKKILVFAICLLSATATFSQYESEETGYKQVGEDKSLELQFDPGAIFGSNGGNIFSNGLGVRMRFFQSESMAYRLNALLNFRNENEITQDADNTLGDEELRRKETDFDFFVMPGFEKHFASSKRLSPYIGAEAIIGFRTSIEKDQTQFGGDVIEVKTKNGNLDDGIVIGAGAVAGVDFYVAKKLYLGLELNYSLTYSIATKTKISSDAPGSTDVETKVGKSNVLNFAPGSMGVFRIGFLFGGGSSSSISLD